MKKLEKIIKMEQETKFIDFDGRPIPRKIEGEHFICCKCGRSYKGRAKFYLAVIEFPFAINPFSILQNLGNVEFKPIGSECVKKDDLRKWAITSRQKCIFEEYFKRRNQIK